ncbi:MAG: metal-sensitive transcriptional regulator [Acidimicrobiales bacterium]
MVQRASDAKTLSAASLPEHVHDDVQKRLRRLEGQIRGLQRLLDEGAGCDEVIHQMAAAKAALDRVGYRLVAAGMLYCVSDPDSPITSDELEKLFLKLS